MDRIYDAAYPDADATPADILEREVPLSSLRRGEGGVVVRIGSAQSRGLASSLARLGFRLGRRVTLVATGPLGGSPWAVEVGGRLYALRRNEAEQIVVRI